MKILHTSLRLFFTLSLLLAVAGINSAYATCTPPVLNMSHTDITCHGAHNGMASVTVSGGVTPYTYSWTSSTGFVSSSPSISGLDSGSYTVVVTEGGGCTETATVIVSQPPALSATPMSNAPFCPGGTLSIFSNVTGGTGSILYNWTGPAGFASIAADPTIATATAANDGIYSLTIIDGHSCSLTSNFSVLLYPEPVVNLGDDTGYICGGTPLVLNAGNPGATYQWNTGAPTQSIVVTMRGSYNVAVTNMYMCTGHDTIFVDTSSNYAPTVTISPFTNNICDGTPVTFHATTTHAGHTPVFTWRVNGVIIPGASSDTYTATAPVNGDYYTTRLTSSFACASPSIANSDTARMNVIANLPVSVTLSHTPDTACTGTPVTFTATPVNGGATPTYLWYRDGVLSGSGTSNTYGYSPTTAQIITVKLVSSVVCHIPDTVSANDTFVLYPHLVPNAHVTFTPNDTVAYLGQVITFYCEVTWGGAAPTYQWYLNRVAQAGATNSTYAPHVYRNDTVKCIVTSSDVCAIPRRDTSNVVIIYASFLGIDGVNANIADMNIFPNPANGDFTLTGSIGSANDNEVNIDIRDLKGSLVYQRSVTVHNGTLNEPLSLSGQLSDGIYLVTVRTDTDEKQVKLIIKR